MSEPPQQPESSKSKICTFTTKEFVRRLLDDVETKVDKNFVLFLGAGCSVSSGIPAAKELVQEQWLPRLRNYRAPHRSDLETWVKEVIPDYDPENPALAYGEVIKQLFPKTRTAPGFEEALTSERIEP